ncbi:MAG: hypothetical protein SAK29_22230 [Scytonema sp. PMC 1069.18]|nr:hypothetical protein [Scytonema sp. PMC 1069.18]MEC4883065.1 hypothetical protein [Scytonema sp. PMC 1070.18]
MQLSIGSGGAIFLVVLSVISAGSPQKQLSGNLSDLTTQSSKIRKKHELTDNNTTKENKAQNNCMVVTLSSNLRDISGLRRTGKVIPAGTKVTVTGKHEGGWIEISAPESGWIWKDRTNNSCPLQ